MHCKDTILRTQNNWPYSKLIPNSGINVLDEQFAVIADSTLQKDKPIALYCRSGKRSKKAAAILSRKGYKVYELDKGFIGWKETGKETEK